VTLKVFIRSSYLPSTFKTIPFLLWFAGVIFLCGIAYVAHRAGVWAGVTITTK
jgi:hypothetical protein